MGNSLEQALEKPSISTWQTRSRQQVEQELASIVKYLTGTPTSFVPLLGLFHLKGAPFSLRDHFPMEPLFKCALPGKTLYKCARQVSKSMSLSIDGCIRSACTPALSTLFITPRYEQIRRLSANYVRPLIKTSIINHLMVDESCTQQVLQRSFINEAAMYFSFCFIDCERVRGLSVDLIKADEIQDLDPDFLPIINECMSHSEYSISSYSGTPKTKDNGIEDLWQRSSQAEWVIPCFRCGYWNMCSAEADLLKMLSPVTLVCRKCQKPVDPHDGQWYHTAIKNKGAAGFHGYHVPQPILPLHCHNPKKWKELLSKRGGAQGYTEQKFMNEVLGESCDVGVTLVTETDLKRVSVLGTNDYHKALASFIANCDIRAVSVDWGGGGLEEVSHTVASFVGWNNHLGKVQCYFTIRFHSGLTHHEEAQQILRMFHEGSCDIFAHDYGGSGSVRESIMIQAGLPIDRIMNICYQRASSRTILYYNQPTRAQARGFYTLDKARSLVLQASCIKGNMIDLPEYESSKNITNDILALVEDKHEMAGGSDVYLIRRKAKLSDDFAHSLNFGCVAMWHLKQAWPNIAEVNNMQLSQETIEKISPVNAFRES